MALPNDMQRTADMIAGLGTSDANFTNDAKKSARNLIRRTYFIEKAAADAMASTTTSGDTGGLPQLRMRSAGRILAMNIVPHSTLTANDTNFGTVQLEKRDGLGGAAVVAVATQTTVTAGTGNWASSTTVASTTLTAANARYILGGLLTVSITKTGTGVVIPACTICIDVEEEDIDGYAV